MKTNLIAFILIFLSSYFFESTASNAQPQFIKSTWDWVMPKSTENEQREFVRFAEDCGFNTVIVRPTETIIDEAHNRKMLVFDILTPSVSDEFVKQHPGCLQKMVPFEESIDKILKAMPYKTFNVYVQMSHREFNIFYQGDYLCYEHEESIEELCREIKKQFDAFPIDGIALDFFGFKNLYACFCEKCQALRKEIKAKNPSLTDDEIIATFSEESLIKVSQRLYEYIKSIKPDAIVAAHIYPNFNPNPFYGNRFRVDYCGQTIAWFFKPFWTLEQVTTKARRFKSLEDPKYNRFMPFVACYGQQETVYLKKSPEQLRSEFLIAKEFGSGNVMFATLGVLREHRDLFEAVKGVLKQW